MTAPMTSREELLKNHTMPDLPCPVCGTLCRADVVLRHKQAISDNAQGSGDPAAWEAVGPDLTFKHLTGDRGVADIWEKSGLIVRPLYALPSTGLPASAPHAEVREAAGALTKIAAECHRAKWQFDLTENYKPTAKARHDLIITAFRELHRIGDLALKIRDGFAIPHQDRGGK